MQHKEILTRDHVRISNTHVSRAYFDTLLASVVAAEKMLRAEIADGALTAQDQEPISLYMGQIFHGLLALSHKYRMSGLVGGPVRDEVTIDGENSGFPIAQEFYMMAADIAGAAQALATFPTEDKLRSEMLREILTQAQVPTRLRNVMAQRQYTALLSGTQVFLPKNVPTARLISPAGEGERTWRVDWAVYDNQINIPVLYMMDIRDSGRHPMAEDLSTWPALTQHLLAQSIAMLSPKTIVEGVDRDFRRLHPMRLRRLFLGPLYAHEFTVQDGQVNTALTKAGHGAWALASVLETVRSKASKTEGLFSRTEIQEYGDVTSEQFMLSPIRVFQSVQDNARTAFDDATKYVLQDDGNVRRRG